MDLLNFIFLLAGGVICIFFGLFTINSIREKKLRAATINAGIVLFAGLFWFGGYILFSPGDLYQSIALIIASITAIIFFLPIGTNSPLLIGDIKEKVDERDVIFAREEYLPGTDKYEKYYTMKPEYKTRDDKIRKLPELLEPGGHYYDPVQSGNIRSIFGVIRDLATKVDGEINPVSIECNPVEMAGKIKTMVRRLGADEVGITELNPMFVYSHVGRGPHTWGSTIENNHRFAIVFTLEMDYAQVEAAPQLPITEESALQYLKGAQISISVAEYIRTLGYPARAHIAGSNYQIMLPPIAHDAGLGELGRIGYLISPKHGARIRLGAVTTNLPLSTDKPITFGVQDFCKKCLKCAVNCPSGAIPGDSKSIIRDVEKWPLNIERCIHYWRAIGTDCGVCMKVCPFSHPSTLIHNIIRKGINRSSFIRPISIWGDDLFYGRRVNMKSTSGEK